MYIFSEFLDFSFALVNGVVRMAPRLRLGYSDFISREMNDIFLYFKTLGLNLGLTQTSVQQAPGVPSVG